MSFTFNVHPKSTYEGQMTSFGLKTAEKAKRGEIDLLLLHKSVISIKIDCVAKTVKIFFCKLCEEKLNGLSRNF
jgi:hypothetical protein